MSKSTLEQLLLEASDLNEKISNRADQNQKSVLQNTMKEEVRKFIREAVGEETEADDSMDYDEASVDSDTGAEMDMADASDDAASETDYSEEAGEEESTMDDEAEDMSMDDAIAPPMDDEMDSEEVMDLTNATEEEVMQALANLPDNAKIEIVKKPAFDVNISGAETMGIDMSMDVDDSIAPPMGMDDEMSDDEEIEVDGMDDEEDNEMDEIYESKEDLPFDTSVNNIAISSGDKTKKPFATTGNKGINSKTSVGSIPNTVTVNEMEDLEEACQDNSLTENRKNNARLVTEINKLKTFLKRAIQENKQLKANEDKAVGLIKESMGKMKKLALVNSNLAYVSRLFTEHSTTKKEKLNILQKFDKAKTVGESEIMFNMLKESLNKRINTTPNISQVNLVESATSRRVIKEEKVYVDPTQQRMLEIMNYKPKA